MHLMILSTHFGRATGEIFNLKGKTGILIRHEKSNVFVEECKFWRGEKTAEGWHNDELLYGMHEGVS